MSLYEPTTRRARILWAAFTVAAFSYAIWAYVDYLVTHP